MKIITLDKIKEIIAKVDLIACAKQSFIAYSQSKAVVPPIGEMIFNNPPGDVHIKYGYIIDDEDYLVKIASGFYQNPTLNLPSSGGVMLLFSQKTGQLKAILLDEGHLTNLRTAAAGAVAAQYLAPKFIHSIGIVGSGTQAKLQLQYLKTITACRKAMVYGRDQQKLLAFQSEMTALGFDIFTTQKIRDITQTCNLIITATSATSPLLFAQDIQPGTHITAVGADSPHKQELDQSIFKIADIIAADSIAQCQERGDSAHAIKSKAITPSQMSELGSIIQGHQSTRTTDQQITVADLTGLAVQDIYIAKSVVIALAFLD